MDGIGGKAEEDYGEYDLYNPDDCDEPWEGDDMSV